MILTELELVEVKKTELDRMWDELNSGCMSDNFLNSLAVLDFEREYLAWWEVTTEGEQHAFVS